MWSSVASERSITVHWKLNCADEPIVAGYNFTYCLLDDDDPTKCAERMNEKIELLGNVSEMNQFSILGLKSYRLYNVSISLMSHSRLGILKAPISVRTLEGGKLRRFLGFHADQSNYLSPRSSNCTAKSQSHQNRSTLN